MKTMRKDVRVQEVGHILMSDFWFAKGTIYSDKKIFQLKNIAFKALFNDFSMVFHTNDVTFYEKSY
jgi:hypothetical protein